MSTVSQVVAASKVKHVIVGVGNVRYPNTPQSLGFSVMNVCQRRLKLKWEYKPVIGCQVAAKGNKLFVQPQHFAAMPTAKAVSSILKYHNLGKGNLTIVHDDVAIPSGRYVATRETFPEIRNERVIILEALLGSGFRKFSIGSKPPAGEGFSSKFMDANRGHGSLRKGKPMWTLSELEPKMPFLPRQKESIIRMFEEEENDIIKRISEPNWIGNNLREGEILNREEYEGLENDEDLGEIQKAKYTLVYDKYNAEGEGVGDYQLVQVPEYEEGKGDETVRIKIADEGGEGEIIVKKDTQVPKLEISNDASIFALQQHLEVIKNRLLQGKDIKGITFKNFNDEIYHKFTLEEIKAKEGEEGEEGDLEDPEDSLEEEEIVKVDEGPEWTVEQERMMLEYLAPSFIKDAALRLRTSDLSTEEGIKKEVEQMEADIYQHFEGKKLLEERFGPLFPEDPSKFLDDEEVHGTLSRDPKDYKAAVKEIETWLEKVEKQRKEQENFSEAESARAGLGEEEEEEEDEDEEEEEEKPVKKQQNQNTKRRF
eukprot:TRINITY_DN2309_c2_g1_i1.p1 TRINITY_DN2309_c2_g1~~TRINITY_DN2309_c2_g1_i1.p1  ORF type:complete len:555 (+),score=214.89 TRINITY_DN2309_c2_g1_i1:49-1665(+)